VSFDWSSYLSLARELAVAPGEAARRSAVSRAYYTVFNKARLMLEREGVVVATSGKAHEDVWNALERAGKGRRRLGQGGKRLRDQRRKADYDDEIREFDKFLEDAMRSAESLNRLVDAESAKQPDE
jgi:uncharacterized protein (UPF0332 family)